MEDGDELVKTASHKACQILNHCQWDVEKGKTDSSVSFVRSDPALAMVADWLVDYLNSWTKWKDSIFAHLCEKTSFVEFLIDGFKCVRDESIEFNSEMPKHFLLTIPLSGLNVASDASVKAGKKMAADGVVPLLFKMIRGLEKEELSSNHDLRDTVSTVVSTIHNLSKLSEYKSEFDAAEAIEVLKFYLSYPDEKIQMSAFCAVACLIGENDSADLVDSYEIIPKLIACLDTALATDEHSAKGFSAEELVASLAFLAVNDHNKKKLSECNTVPLLAKMLDGNELEQQRAADCLWTLAFDDEIRKEIKARDGICDRLAQIAATSSDAALKVKAQRASDFIQLGGDGLVEQSKAMADLPGEHIFISYSWKQQSTVFKIQRVLLDAGHKVWIDVDRMRGSTLEAMAQAVENAKLVLVCYSEYYRLSNMCRCEAEYMFKLGKPFVPINMQYRYQPTGWLGIIIGARLYIDFSLAKHPFDKVSPRLITEIENAFAEHGSQDSKPPALAKTKEKTAELDAEPRLSCQRCKVLESLISEGFSSGGSTKPSLSNYGAKDDKVATVRRWSGESVGKWLGEQGLTRLASRLQDFDGQALVGLHDLKYSVADLYYTSLLQLMGDSFMDCIKLSAALDKLLCQ